MKHEPKKPLFEEDESDDSSVLEDSEDPTSSEDEDDEDTADEGEESAQEDFDEGDIIEDALARGDEANAEENPEQNKVMIIK